MHRHPNPPSQKFSVSSDFGHFILKMLESAKFLNVSRKRLLKNTNFWGTRSPPPPPLSAPMALSISYQLQLINDIHRELLPNLHWTCHSNRSPNPRRPWSWGMGMTSRRVSGVTIPPPL